MGSAYEAWMEIKDIRIVRMLEKCMCLSKQCKGKTKEEIEDIDYEDRYVIDLAKLFGLRKLNEEPKELEYKYINQINKLAGWCSTNEFANGNISKYSYKKGCAVLTMYGWNGVATGVFEYISKLTPLHTYTLYIWSEPIFDDNFVKTYTLVNGEPTSERKAKEQKQKEEHNKGLKLLNEGKYEEAISFLKKLSNAGYSIVDNDIGVCYERLGKYDIAKKWYKRANTTLGKENLLWLYYNKRATCMDIVYEQLCEELQREKSQIGYLLEARKYTDSEDFETQKKGFDILLEGTMVCDKRDRLLLDLAYSLYHGEGCEKDLRKALCCYWYIIKMDEYDFRGDVNYEYAMMCYKGEGCKPNVKRAIYYLERAAEAGYKKAKEKLVELYSSKEFYDKDKLEELDAYYGD